MDHEVFRRVYPRDYIKRFLDNGVRPDGRSLMKSRKLSMTTGSISTAVGSAMLKLGRTTAVAGVIATLVEPLPNTPEEGILDLSVEILSTVSQNFKRINDDALVLSHAVRHWLGPHIDRSTLCVESGKLVWHLRLTVYCIDDDGNLYDAVLLAAVAALKNVMLPSVTMLDDFDASSDAKNNMHIDTQASVERSVVATASVERTNPLQMDDFPLAVSFSIMDDSVLMDPSAEEESVADSRLTFILHPSGELRAVEKPGGKHLSGTLYETCLNSAKARALVLLDKLNSG